MTPRILFWSLQAGLVFYLLAALLVLSAMAGRREGRGDSGLFLLTLLAPAVLWLCWWSQSQFFREIDTLFWSRLMAGDVAAIFRLGSGGLVFGALLATVALTLGRRTPPLYLSIPLLASIWPIMLLHPKPHYVPVPAWLDKLGWFMLLIGGGAALAVIHRRYRHDWAKWRRPVTILAALVALTASGSLLALNQATRPLDLASLSAKARISQMGCLACHSMGETGYPDPGGSLEATASRDQETLLQFLRNPDTATARALQIRSQPSGDMTGLHLTDSQARLLTEALREIFPPDAAALGTKWSKVEAILDNNRCLACHSLDDRGAAGGGLGGPLEGAAQYEFELLQRWLMEPTPKTARQLGLTTTPTGAMASYALSEQEARLVATWLRSLQP
ncbi:MAG: c-type cytochrome [Desulfurivibrio sp.]|nr:c-type cytochrome [Desulfurivibrio sp.]